MSPAEIKTPKSKSTSLPDTAKFQDAKAEHPGRVFIAQPGESESEIENKSASPSINFAVDFDGEDDQTNPVNWPLWYKWTLIIVLSSVNTIA